MSNSLSDGLWAFILGKVFAEALTQARPGCFLATNTLSLSLNSIQEAVNGQLGTSKAPSAVRPRVVGLRAPSM